MFRKTMVVVCATALVGVFAGYAAADFIYDFDSNVGQTLTVDQILKDQDGWVRSGGTSDNMFVRQEESGYWTSKHIEVAQGVQCAMQRVNDVNWSYSIQEDQDFDMSAVFYSQGDDIWSVASLAFNHPDLGYKFPFLVSVYGGDFWWFAREGYFGDIKLNYKLDIPTLDANIYRVGMEVTALGSGDYTLQGYYEDLTTPGDRVYVAEAVASAHFDTFDVFDRLHFSLQSASANSYSARMDDFRIEQIPEPSALALLGCGLIGLLAYAWRKTTIK